MDVDELDKRISTHEAVCSERYENIILRLNKLEKISMAGAGALIAGMATLIVKLAKVV